MKLEKTWWLPEWDTHYKEHITQDHDGNFQYQKNKEIMQRHIVKFKTFALDVGGNIGFWSKDLAKKV